MIITKLEKYKGQTWLLELDNEKTVYLHQNLVFDNHLRENSQISQDELDEIYLQSQKRKAWEYSLYILDYRDHSYAELFEKLSKNYDDDICYETLNKLAKLGLINDRRYAENLAQKLIEGKKYGYYRASFEMQKKGIDRELCDEILSEYEDGEEERLYVLIGRKYARNLCDDKGIAKVKSALVRQGYGFDSINNAIDRYLEEN